MRLRPFRTTDRSDPRSTRRAIAFRLSPVSSAASVIVYVRKLSSLGRRLCRTRRGRATRGVPRGSHTGVAARGKGYPAGCPAAEIAPERGQIRAEGDVGVRPGVEDVSRLVLEQSRGVAQPG
jgi:hypothetical protein